MRFRLNAGNPKSETGFVRSGGVTGWWELVGSSGGFLAEPL